MSVPSLHAFGTEGVTEKALRLLVQALFSGSKNTGEFLTNLIPGAIWPALKRFKSMPAKPNTNENVGKSLEC